MTPSEYRKHIEAIVAKAPPLSKEQVEFLRGIFRKRVY